MQWHQNPAPLVCLCGGGGESVGTSNSTSDSFAFNLLHPLHGRLINFDDKIVVENDITSESTSLERNIHCFLKLIPHPPKNTQTIWPNPSTSRKLSICWHKTHFHPRLLKFNIAREKWWLEDYFPIGARSLFNTFQGRAVKHRGGTFPRHPVCQAVIHNSQLHPLRLMQTTLTRFSSMLPVGTCHLCTTKLEGRPDPSNMAASNKNRPCLIGDTNTSYTSSNGPKTS